MNYCEKTTDGVGLGREVGVLEIPKGIMAV